jgi:hypothetical protein
VLSSRLEDLDAGLVVAFQQPVQLAGEEPATRRVAVAFDELALAI